MEMEWTQEYREKFNNVIKHKLPQNFVTVYERFDWFHDWFLEDFYLASTGRFLQNYSTKRRSTFEIQLYCGDGKRLLISYINVKKLDISTLDDPLNRFHPRFDECIVNLFDILENDILCHSYLFANGDKILIQFEKIKYKWIRGF